MASILRREGCRVRNSIIPPPPACWREAAHDHRTHREPTTQTSRCCFESEVLGFGAALVEAETCTAPHTIRRTAVACQFTNDQDH